MHYLINARFLAAPMTESGRVARELLSSLLEVIALRGPERRPKLEIAAPRGVPIPAAEAAGVALVQGPSKLFREQIVMPWLRPGATIVNLANSAPILAWRSIVWMHDANVFEAPENYKLSDRLWRQNLLRACVLRRFAVITVSHYARRALIAHGADPARTSVIANAGDHILRASADASFADALGLEPKGFVLVAGGRAKRKNTQFAVRALAERLAPEIKIVVSGQQDDVDGEMVDEALTPDPRITILPMLAERQLRAVYERARCVVIPSVLEGFSLPAAEAMWCGAPLVLCNRAALPEIGGAAALYFEPEDADGLVQAVLKTDEDATRAKLLTAASIQREKYRWRASARQLLDVYLH